MKLPADISLWPLAAAISDFSLVFEEVVLQLLPSGSFLCFAGATVIYYCQRPARVHHSRLLWIKLIVATILVVLELALMVLRCVSAADRTDTTYGAAALDFAAALGVGAVIYVEHRHAIRTSALLGLYLAVGLLIDITKSRSYFKRDFNAPASVAVGTATVRLALIILEEVPKAHLLIDPEVRRISGGEATSGFFTRTLFLFLHSILSIGFRGALTLEDLGSLGLEFDSESLFENLSQVCQTNTSLSLFLASLKTWKIPILAVLVPRVCVSGLKFALPFLMRDIIETAKVPWSDDTQKRIGLVGATALTFIGAALCRAATSHMQNRLITRYRGGLFSHLLHKSYRLEVSDARKNAAITLMSADFDGIATSLPGFIELPFTLLDSGLGMLFLSQFIGLSCLSIFIPLVVSIMLGLLFGRFSTPALKHWNENIETRVAKTSRILSQLSAVKALGLGTKAAEFIQYLRVTEVASSKKYRIIQSISTGLAVVVDTMTPVVVVAVALFSAAFGNEISAQKLYPTLGIVALVQGPLADILKSYTTTMAMLGCFNRIEIFLRQTDHKDPRIFVFSVHQQISTDDKTTETPQDTSEATPTLDPTLLCRFDNATIVPQGSNKHVLTAVSLTIVKGSINGVYGPTSSGKSTFLESIIGETEIHEGSLYIDHVAITVCGHQVWLPNVTFRECIIGNCEYDSVWFNLVVIRCGLQEDLEALPDGENHIVGSNGITLSGGQRQRIGIARSVYPQPAAIIFDDIFSSIDKRTANLILTGLCGENGILRSSGCTVIMSTYMTESLDVVENLILLDGNGTVSCEPRWKQDGRPSDAAILLQLGIFGPLGDDVEAESSTQPNQNHGTVSRTSNTYSEGERQNGAKERRKGDWKLYLLWFAAIGGLSTTLWALLVLIMGATEIFNSIYVRIWIAVAPKDHSLIIGYAMVALTSGFLTSLCIFFNHVQLSPRASIGLHERLTSTVTRSTLGFLSTTDSGVILNHYSQDMELISKRIPQAVYATLYCGATSIVQVGIILSTASYMVVALPVILIGIFVIQHYHLRSSRQLRLLEIEAQAPLVKEFQETSTGVVYIRAFGIEAHSFNRSLRLLDMSQRPFYFLLCTQAFLSLNLDVLTSFVAVILVIVALFTRSASSNATGLALLTLINVGTSFNRLLSYWALSEISVGSLARLRDFFRNTPKEFSNRNPVALPSNWPSSGAVDLTNVSAQYRVKKDASDESVLHNITLSVEPGKKIGIMGRSGSGKSSLLSTLLGFLEFEGSIMIDGVDIKTAHPDQLRSRIVTISQDIVELEGTVRDNLLPYDKVWGAPSAAVDESENASIAQKDAVVRETLVRLGIWEQLRKKGELDAVLGKVGYSQGEKQLFCIARAVVRRRLTGSRLLLVDEATANVDPGRDQIVREMMIEYFRGCTIIIVAHRVDTIADSNRTVHMAGGHISRVENHW